MDINNLTFGQIKEINALFSSQQSHKADSLASRAVGKYVIVRSRNEGINAGVVVEADETGVILSDARRLWHHKPKDKGQSWYEGVANTGLSSDSQISSAVSEKVIIESYSLTICTAEAEKSIRGHKAHDQT